MTKINQSKNFLLKKQTSSIYIRVWGLAPEWQRGLLTLQTPNTSVDGIFALVTKYWHASFDIQEQRANSQLHEQNMPSPEINAVCFSLLRVWRISTFLREVKGAIKDDVQDGSYGW